ncbi:MAG: helix-turn-helix transcriptional regulator [Proteobacteria bacterium]|nr:helix-turn-helix transcriptional regulator [Pseudomonadota bacterium]
MGIRTPTEFGAAVREAREAAQISQAQLASKIGTTQARLSRFESGDGAINLRTVLQILAEFDMQLEIQKQKPDESNNDEEEDIDLTAIANTGVKASRGPLKR